MIESIYLVELLQLEIKFKQGIELVLCRTIKDLVGLQHQEIQESLKI